MAHLCPTCSETCYCMGDFTETLSGQPAYCKHCTEYEPSDEFEVKGLNKFTYTSKEYGPMACFYTIGKKLYTPVNGKIESDEIIDIYIKNEITTTHSRTR